MEIELEAANEALGVRCGAEWNQVVEARRDLLQVWRPDRFSHDELLRLKAELQTKTINSAFAVIFESRKNRASAEARESKANQTRQPPQRPTPASRAAIFALSLFRSRSTRASSFSSCGNTRAKAAVTSAAIDEPRFDADTLFEVDNMPCGHMYRHECNAADVLAALEG